MLRQPAALPKRSWRAVLRRSIRIYRRGGLPDQAAALTYYGILAIFPGLLALLSIMGLLGRSTTQAFLDDAHTFVPGGVNTFLHSAIRNVEGRGGAASVAVIIGIVLALWAASGYVAAFMRASNAIYSVDEGRPIWRTAPLRFGVSVLLCIMLVASVVIVAVTGPVADEAGRAIGVGSAAVTAWGTAKWPVLLILVSLMLALLYWASPNVKQPGVRWILPGAALAVVIWLAASGLFGVYLGFSSSYNKTYGSLAGVIIFLVWLWISNTAVLLGVVFNAEMQRERLLQAGLPEGVTPFLDLRDTRKLDDAELERVDAARRQRLTVAGI
ncbi:MAG TPA: YihY/virulence factor BrkB family protein [Jatrophihabitantaceae bacterium]|nr:YihY/virulence factor BrkB family protein [Jatrophihabitantaceae bacterium]